MDNDDESISNPSSTSNEVLTTMVRKEIKRSYHELADMLSQRFDEILKMNMAENIQKNVEDPIIRQIANISPRIMGNDMHGPQNIENNAWGQQYIEENFRILFNKPNCLKVGKSTSHFLYSLEKEAPVASSTQRDDPLIPSTGGGVPATTSCRPFHPPRSEIGPNPQLNVEGNQYQGIDEEEVNPLTNGVDSIDDHIDRLVEESNVGNSRGRRNAKPWAVHADGTITKRKMTVAQVMKPLHGTKVVLQFDTSMEPIEDSGGLLSGVLGVETLYFDDQNETIKGYTLKSLDKS
ncbi:hypothetical protein PIB30_000001 [Stylosanthes scabra]|uniref:Uncharacterized protein n=1 Tax=Stylosanthes scabra TaxID=79078 RepID=A0ABU6Q1T7_9FABA|nr:hypothetical protein [Stylosanthes scabra]